MYAFCEFPYHTARVFCNKYIIGFYYINGTSKLALKWLIFLCKFEQAMISLQKMAEFEKPICLSCSYICFKKYIETGDKKTSINHWENPNNQNTITGKWLGCHFKS